MWAPTLPAGWDVVAIKRLARVESGHTPSRSEPSYWVPDECTIPWFTLADIKPLRQGTQRFVESTSERISPRGLQNSSARVLPAGTVILSRTASVGFPGILGVPMATTQDFVNWVCGERLWPDYLYWSLRAMRPELDRIMMGSTHQTIYMPDLLDLRTPAPPLPTQRAIAAFLDRKTAAIDALIAKKEALRALLAERRASYRGAILGPLAAPYVKLGYLADVLPGYAFSASDFSESEQDIRLVRGVNVAPGGLRWDDVARWPQDQTAGLSRFWLRPGDLVLGMDRPWIKVGLRLATVTSDDCPSLLLQRVARLRPGPRLDADFLRLNLEWGRFQAHLEPETTGVSVPHISRDQILSYRLPLVPLDVQSQLVRRVQKVDEVDEAASGRLAVQLTRLHEYRQALVTAAVTGRITVPEGA